MNTTVTSPTVVASLSPPPKCASEKKHLPYPPHLTEKGLKVPETPRQKLLDNAIERASTIVANLHLSTSPHDAKGYGRRDVCSPVSTVSPTSSPNERPDISVRHFTVTI